MRALLIASAVVLVGFAPAPLPRRGKGPDNGSRLEGVWLVQSIRLWGNSTGGVVHGQGLSVLVGDRMVIRRRQAAFRDSFPRTYSVRFPKSAGSGAFDLVTGPAHHLLGIYELSGENLTLAVNAHGRPRPPTFEGKDAQLVIVLRKTPE
jgi:uncharacterized protein (TIGR03067 family)